VRSATLLHIARVSAQPANPSGKDQRRGNDPRRGVRGIGQVDARIERDTGHAEGNQEQRPHPPPAEERERGKLERVAGDEERKRHLHAYKLRDCAAQHVEPPADEQREVGDHPERHHAHVRGPNVRNEETDGHNEAADCKRKEHRPRVKIHASNYPFDG
jgi:hypothetical protein